MTPEQLKASILQYAIQGKLVEQRPEEGTGEELYRQIQAEKLRLIKTGKLKKTRALPTITDEEVPYDFPTSWKVCYIDDIAFVTKLAGFEYTKYIADNLVPTGIPLFKGKNVQNGKLVLSFESYIPESVSDELPRSQITKKCLLTPYVGTIGNIAVFDGSFKAHLGSNVGKIELLNSDTQTFILEEYVLWYLKSTCGYAELTKYKKSTAQESISIDAIRNVAIAIPPLEEQRRIVAKIEELLPYVDRYAAAYEKLEQFNAKFPEDMKKSILQYAIQGKLVEQRPEEGTGEELYRQIQTEKQRLIKEGKIKKEKPLAEITEDEKPYDIPDNWTWVRFGDLGSYKKGPFGSAITKSMFVPKGNGAIKVYEQKNAIQKDATLGDYYIRRDYFESKMKGFEVFPGDIIVSCAGTIGETYVMPDEFEQGIINQALMRMKIFEPLYIPYFLTFFDFVLKKNARSSSKGSAIKNIPPFEILKNYLVPIPPLAEQKRIVAKLEEILPLFERLK